MSWGGVRFACAGRLLRSFSEDLGYLPSTQTQAHVGFDRLEYPCSVEKEIKIGSVVRKLVFDGVKQINSVSVQVKRWKVF